MVECEDGRRRQARLYGESWVEEGHEDYQPEKRECSSCDGINPYDAQFCCYCGNQLSEFPQEITGKGDQQEEVFTITKAAVRVKGKHIQGEAWFSCKSGLWYFLSDPAGKNHHFLPRHRQRPEESKTDLLRSLSVRTK
jgi:hypothetical protein